MPAIAERLPAAAAARPSLLPLLALGLCAPTLVPLFATAWAWTQADADTVAHLARHVLPRASAQSAWLVLGVSAGAALLGTTLAALVASLGHAPAAVSTAVNGDFVPRGQRERPLAVSDVVLLFQPIVGG